MLALTVTVVSCARQEMGWSAPSYMLSEPPAGLMSPVALAPAPCDPSALMQSPLLQHMPAAAQPQPFGVQLVPSAIFPPQVSADECTSVVY